jgi:hypothetical protein
MTLQEAEHGRDRKTIDIGRTTDFKGEKQSVDFSI